MKGEGRMDLWSQMNLAANDSEVSSSAYIRSEDGVAALVVRDEDRSKRRGGDMVFYFYCISSSQQFRLQISSFRDANRA